MNFTWKMTEQDYKRLLKDNAKKSGAAAIRDDVYGQCMVGGLCADIQHTLDCSDWYAFANVFQLGKDTGYGTTDDGTPYDLVDDGPAVPLDAASFDEFKAEFEKNFAAFIEKKGLAEAANQTTPVWSDVDAA